MRPEDVITVAALQQECFPPPFPAEDLWQPESLRAHLVRFPEGQFVAEINREVVGSASNVTVSEDTWQHGENWHSFAGSLDLAGHAPEGSTLFGLDICVSRSARGKGVGQALYRARFDLTQKLGLVRFGTICRLPGLAQHPQLSPEQFACKVVDGTLTDSPLSPFLKMGMRYVGVVNAYMHDVESRNAGAKLEWTP